MSPQMKPLQTSTIAPAPRRWKVLWGSFLGARGLSEATLCEPQRASVLENPARLRVVLWEVAQAAVKPKLPRQTSKGLTPVSRVH